MQFFPRSDIHATSKRPQDSFMHRILNDPYLDWFYMVVITIILTGLYVGIGFMTYFSMQNSLSATTKAETISRTAVFDSEALSRTLKDFEKRALERASIMKGYNVVGDPSL